MSGPDIPATLQRVTVVTGGSRGIGAATALRLARAGHHVGIGYAHDEEAAARTAEAVRAAGGDAVTARVDTSDAEAVDGLFDTVRSAIGPVTGLVNNAGISGPLGRFTETAPEVMRRVVDVNVTGALLCARRALREMSTAHGGQGGAIVNVSSSAATLGSPGEYVHYAASKAAVDAMTVGLAKEFTGEGVRVNCVQPGSVLTGMHAAMGDPDRAWKKARTTPAGRPGEPEEIADAVAWLLSDEASYTSGAVLRVAGGL
ncbi:SDR family oxidoreductase [Streptomyces reniochalinae]|uniref:SDR family NAD(P)-dependent oxidoreductase n=1 Tax=Streptomyces reniochalinae TaxID=2250578 RepID=A0A367E875_9ACTN|nr:SDR family oxidoreductase [Streptomyces reniochalinae]RCG13855.1 SDR family NAD(P)-dependent oxidoreductase [Streptomyces reniochalinae]